MSIKKQVIVLQDLGVSKEYFLELASAAGLPYEFIWDDWQHGKTSENVEGILTIRVKANKQLLDHFPNLKFIAVPFTGYDHVDLDLCRERNIAVFNVPAYSTDSVAELTIGLIISLLREIPRGDTIVRSDGWDLGPTGSELKGKCVGIIGTGAIGLRVAELFKAFGCPLLGWSHTKRDEFQKLGGKYVATLEELCATADIISVHVPLNKDTVGLLDEKQFAVMKPTAYVINTSRGPIINQKVLTKALETKQIAGAAVDVYEVEPVPADDPLLKTTNSVLTPHIAYKTNEALKRRAQVTVENIKGFIEGKEQNKVI